MHPFHTHVLCSNTGTHTRTHIQLDLCMPRKQQFSNDIYATTRPVCFSVNSDYVSAVWIWHRLFDLILQGASGLNSIDSNTKRVVVDERTSKSKAVLQGLKSFDDNSVSILKYLQVLVDERGHDRMTLTLLFHAVWVSFFLSDCGFSSLQPGAGGISPPTSFLVLLLLNGQLFFSLPGSIEFTLF